MPFACGIFESLSGSPFGRDSVDYPALIRAIQTAETSGYEYYFLIEHQSTPYPGITSPNVFLAAVAQATKTIRLGHSARRSRCGTAWSSSTRSSQEATG